MRINYIISLVVAAVACNEYIAAEQCTAHDGGKTPIPNQGPVVHPPMPPVVTPTAPVHGNPPGVPPSAPDNLNNHPWSPITPTPPVTPAPGPASGTIPKPPVANESNHSPPGNYPSTQIPPINPNTAPSTQPPVDNGGGSGGGNGGGGKVPNAPSPGRNTPSPGPGNCAPPGTTIEYIDLCEDNYPNCTVVHVTNIGSFPVYFSPDQVCSGITSSESQNCPKQNVTGICHADHAYSSCELHVDSACMLLPENYFGCAVVNIGAVPDSHMPETL
uniref:AlNc14C200G8677 protein n=1 Tax=Albugo laibachii Nc14 TaxID=890382 RepID=F0WQK8_9STRA|nr:AlNc14C200G8677 [Albugo laibachii Nc14]CCA24149.1 AlNc14C224G9171 [Albugo laibachii Nc14]|eukprot:CCA24149.1 AlNc14C224G9171 [Albugo laibachii Nc14]